MYSRVIRTTLAIAGLVLLVLLVRRTGTAAIAGMLRRTGLAFAPLTALYAAHTALRGVALWQTLSDPAVKMGEVVRIRFGTEGLEMLTQTGPFLAEPAKGWLLHRSGAGAARAFGAVAAEFLLYNLTAAWMAAGSMLLLLWRGALPGALRAPALGVVAAIGLFTAGSFIAAITGVGLIAPALRAVLRLVAPHYMTDVLARVVPVEGVLVSFLHDNPARLAAVVAVEGLGHALLVIEIRVVLEALGFTSGWMAALIIEGAVKVIGAVFFFVPGQVGVSESTYAVITAALGLPAAAGVTLGLVRRARALAIGAIGFALLVMPDRARD